MTEERRAQPVAAAADGAAAPAELDDIPIEEAPAATPPRVEAKVPPPAPSTPAPIPADRPSRGGNPADTSPSARRVRARMTLRIPDDEVSRPTPVAAAAVRTPDPNSEIQATRIISIEPGPPDPEPDDGDLDRTPHSGIPPVTPSLQDLAAATAALPPRQQTIVEDSWTPYAPTAADSPPRQADFAHRSESAASVPLVPPAVPSDAESTGEFPPPISEEIPIALEVAGGNDSAEPLDLDDAVPASRPTPPAPKPSASIKAVSPPSHAMPVAPRSAAVSGPTPSARPPMRAMYPTDPEGEEVRFDDDDEHASGVPAPPTTPMDLSEIAAEDLVSVESSPTVDVPSTALPQMRPKAKSIPPPAPGAKSAPQGPTSHATHAPAPAANPSSGAQPVASRVAPRLMVPDPAPSPLAPPAMTEAAAARKRTRPWWEELFNDDFIRTMAKITDPQIAAEATFIEESLGVAPGAMVLDLACGTGRHAIELTRRGYKVVGFDLSLSMLARAADEAYDRSQKLNFVQGDMREMTFENTFDGVYCWNTSFGFFEEEKNAQVVQRVHRSLRPGGQFLLDVVNRDYISRQQPSLAWFEGDGCICMDEMQIDWITSRMRTKRTMMMDDGRTKEIEYSIRLYALHELGKLLHDNGFKVVEVSGRTATPGVFFGNESPRTLILAEKR